MKEYKNQIPIIMGEESPCPDFKVVEVLDGTHVALVQLCPDDYNFHRVVFDKSKIDDVINALQRLK